LVFRMNNKDLKPGAGVNIIIAIDMLKEIADIRGAVVYDIQGENIILSQTNRPLKKRHIGKDLSVTYNPKTKDDLSRLGFEGRVFDIIEEYQLSSSQVVPAILVKKHSDIRQYNLRMQYRVKPRLKDSFMTISMENEKMNLLDISIGGALLCHKSHSDIQPGEKRKIILSIQEKQFPMNARVLSSYVPSEAGRDLNFEYIRIQFLDMEKSCTRLLGEKIIAIQREYLSGE
jgi:hypothetical protein